MTSRFSTIVGSLAVAFLILSFAAFAQTQRPPNSAEPQDPPGRVGRLSFIEGAVQQRGAGDADWTRASLNYPVTNGFAVATQEGGRAEIQVGSMSVRIGSDSELDVNALSDHGTTLTLAQGEINVRLGGLADGDRVEIVTPRGVANIVGVGRYHFDAGSTEQPTRVAVFNGRVEVPRDGGPTVLSSGQSALINSDEASGLTLAASSRDALDDWAIARDPGPNHTAVAGTVSPDEMTGGGDLDQYGTWRHDPRYGEVWYPSGLPADWAPYRYGHWAWVPPWGWTWVDDAPWGFAPFHYGRWIYTANGWAWVPGDYVDYPVYAPALVGFVGFGAAVAWFPLAPFEVFVPAFPVSIAFVRRINITNVNITNINITRVNGNVVVNNTTNVTIDQFANHQFITTVSNTSFTSGRSVNGTMLTQPTARIASTTPVSFSPTNVTAPRTAAATSGWKGTNSAIRPPLPTTSGGSAVAGTFGRTAGGASAIAAARPGRDPKHSQHSLPPLPGSGSVARTATADMAHWHHGSSDTTGSSATAAKHKLPPLPSGRSHASPSTTVNAGVESHHVSPLVNTRRTSSPGSSPLASAGGGRASQLPTMMTPSMHPPIASLAPSRPPNMGTMMPGGPSVHAVPRPASPPMQSREFIQHGGVKWNPNFGPGA